MPIDPSIPMGIQVPKFEGAATLNALSSMKMAQAHSTLYEQQARLQEARMNALKQYGEAFKTGDQEAIDKAIVGVGSVDPEAGNQLQKLQQTSRQIGAERQFGQTGDVNVLHQFPGSYNTVTEAKGREETTTRQHTMAKLDVGSRLMDGWLTTKDKPGVDPVSSWNEALDKGVASGYYTREELAGLYGKPNEMLATRLRAQGMEAAKNMEVTGRTPREVSPAASIVVPGELQDPNAAPAPQPAPGVLPRRPNSAAAPVVPNKSQDRVNDYKDPIIKEIPKVNFDESTQPLPKGVLRQGQDPAALKAKESAQEVYDKDTGPKGRTAEARLSEIRTIKAAINKGGIKTDAAAEARAFISRWTYVLGGSTPQAQEQAFKVSGMTPADAEVLLKNSTRLAFDMSREQGAREAVQVIQFAQAANPNLMNTKEGNLLVADILEKTAEWDKKKSQYAGAWQRVNKDLRGFDQWFNDKHPLATETSKAYPYPVPPGGKGLVDGVSYRYPKNGKEATGIYNAEKGGFEDN